MQASYLGPANDCRCHPSLRPYDTGPFPPTCYLLQASASAGVLGPVIEGDVLVVDEARMPCHGDLVAVMHQQEIELFEAIALGPRYRYRRVGGRETMRVPVEQLKGVVVSLVRRYAG